MRLCLTGEYVASGIDTLLQREKLCHQGLSHSARGAGSSERTHSREAEGSSLIVEREQPKGNSGVGSRSWAAE